MKMTRKKGLKLRRLKHQLASNWAKELGSFWISFTLMLSLTVLTWQGTRSSPVSSLTSFRFTMRSVEGLSAPRAQEI